MKSFSLSIRDYITKDQLLTNDLNQVYVPHKTQFELCIWNSNSVPADVNIYVDGKEVWSSLRIEAHQTVNVDRPKQVSQIFTALYHDTEEGREAKLHLIEPSKRGLVEVICTPALLPMSASTETRFSNYQDRLGRIQPLLSKAYIDEDTYLSRNHVVSSVGVGLSGQSRTRVKSAKSIDLDKTKQEILRLRLIPTAPQLSFVVYEDLIPPIN